MEILLLSQNRVIVEFIKIAIKRLNAKLTTIKTLEEIEDREFDIVIIDEHFTILPCKEVVSKVSHKGSILLSSKDTKECDIVIKKPFLPNDIVEAIKKPILKGQDIDLIKRLFKQIEEDSLEIDIESFIDAVCASSPQTIKKLLKGATISIDFKKGSK